MLRSLRQLIERQIQKARLSGELEGLEGEGKPLPDRTGDAFVSAGDAAGYRMMAEAGVLPEEIEIKKQIDALRQDIKTRKAEKSDLAKLADLELRYNIAREARQKFMKP
jgi:hypothetical protein